MANFPENWCFGILPEPRNFPENWCFGTSTQPRPLAESSQHVHRLATYTQQLLKTSLRWIAIDKKSKWIIWGYPDFRTQVIWFSGHSRLNPNFIIDAHYFAALNILSVAHPVWSRRQTLKINLLGIISEETTRWIWWKQVVQTSPALPWFRRLGGDEWCFSLSSGLNHTPGWIRQKMEV